MAETDHSPERSSSHQAAGSTWPSDAGTTWLRLTSHLSIVVLVRQQVAPGPAAQEPHGGGGDLGRHGIQQLGRQALVVHLT